MAPAKTITPALPSNRRRAKKPTSSRRWEWVVWRDDEHDDSKFTDISKANIISTSRRRTVSSLSPESKSCGAPSRQVQRPKSLCEVEQLSRLTSSNPGFSFNGYGNMTSAQGDKFGPQGTRLTIEHPTPTQHQVSGLAHQSQHFQGGRDERQGAMGTSQKYNELVIFKEKSIGMNERGYDGVVDSQERPQAMGRQAGTAITNDQSVFDMREEQDNLGSISHNPRIDIDKRHCKLGLAGEANSLNVDEKKTRTQPAEIQTLIRPDLPDSIYTTHQDHESEIYVSPYSPKIVPSLAVGAESNIILENAGPRVFPLTSSALDYIEPTQVHKQYDSSSNFNHTTSEFPNTPARKRHDNEDGMFSGNETDQQGPNSSTPTNANIEEELLYLELPTGTPVSPCRESKRRRSNTGGAAATPCTPGITTSADLWGLSSPLSSPPTSPETPPLFLNVCTNPGLCIRIYRNPDLKATRCHNGPKILCQTPTPTTPKARATRATRKVKEGRLAKALQPYYANAQINKPDPVGQPQIWADKRQQLCQTLPYYNAYQSGAFTHAGYVLGFLCDKEVGKRDKFDDQIIISRVGGGRTQDASGNFVQSKDQLMNSTYTSFIRSKETNQPIGVIAGQGNSISPSKLPHYYNVLDWFHITDVWCELNNGCKTWMARFEKINLIKKSWWSPQAGEPLTALSSSTATTPKTTSERCTACGLESKLIYNKGWTCLNSYCEEFFQFPSGLADIDLDYNSAFMKERTDYKGNDPGPLAPPLLTDEGCAKIHAFGIEKDFARGIVCPMCGCCGRRIEWAQWSCENTHCSFIHRVVPKAVPLEETAISGYEIPIKYQDMCHSSIRSLTPKVHGLYDIFEYQMPGPSGETIGFIRLFRSCSIINQQPDGPNALFQQMQTNEFGLKRNPSRNKGAPNEILTSHWAANWGAPYKYGVAQISKGFDETPIVLIKALKRLTWAGEQALTDAAQEAFVPFNELLSLGYFEEADIGYHDDGEMELGPTVATLSLGCSATMLFRPKAKSGIKGPLKRGNARGTQADVLKVVLEHGDIVIMHGRDIQKFYEHSVVPHGKLRFALTARYVRPELMLPGEREYALRAGQLPEGSDKYNYDGDLYATPIAPTKAAEEQIRKFAHLFKAKVQLGEISKARADEIYSEIMG